MGSTGESALRLLLGRAHLKTVTTADGMDAGAGGGTPTSEEDLRAAHREVLQRAGGTYEIDQVANPLGVSRKAVRKRIARGRLLFYSTRSGEHRLPRAQFSESGTIDGLERVLAAMHVQDPWMRIQLFLDDDVIGALQEGRVEDAVRAVDEYLPKDQHTG
jgi:hypothetical protein